MLKSISIKNFVLIDNLQVGFSEGLTTITGETGAGKSILLGGLSLILGKRADRSVIKDQNKKCIIEAIFEIERYQIQDFFKTNDLDYEHQTIIRREILASGKSRAFVNDTPVNLNTLQQLSSLLIDVHAQHQSQEVISESFQLNALDLISNHEDLLHRYRVNLKAFKSIETELQDLKNKQSLADKEEDYHRFLLDELEQAHLDTNDLSRIEEEHKTLSNAEEIAEKLSLSIQLLTDEHRGVLPNLAEIKNTIKGLSSYSNNFIEIFERIQSCYIELTDLQDEITKHQEFSEPNPRRLEEITSRLNSLQGLLHKHKVSTLDDLLKIKTKLQKSIENNAQIDHRIKVLQTELATEESKLNNLAKKIHRNRHKAIPALIDKLQQSLSKLGMPNARFSIDLKETKYFLKNGKDRLALLFTANKGTDFQALKTAASGGERSRIMFALKYILSQHTRLSTLIFDEVDTGISGSISDKMAQMMRSMGRSMQVLAITHLPQIAAKGNEQFKVYKEDIEGKTLSKMAKLNQEERVVELAQMLGGKDYSDSALAHAKQLLAKGLN